MHWEMTAMAFSTNGSSGGNGLSSEINVTPLIDVLLVLLIIFMVIVPVAPHGLKSVLPSAHASATSEPSEVPILVQVEQGASSARYLVDGAAVETAQLAPRLLELMSHRAARQMLLRADAGLDFGSVAIAINAGKAAGAESIGLMTPRVQTQTR
jgi:biopolymer transport protein TolR